MNRIQRYFLIAGLYFLFFFISLKYSPLSDAVRNSEYHSTYNIDNTVFHIVFEPIQYLAKDDSHVLKKILIYGIEQYWDFIEYPLCAVNPNLGEDYTLQVIVSVITTAWIFIAFQFVIDNTTRLVKYDGVLKCVGFFINMSYIFFIENILGYIAQISIFWMQKIILSKPIMIIIKFLCKAFLSIFNHILAPILMSVFRMVESFNNGEYNVGTVVATVIFSYVSFIIIKAVIAFIMDDELRTRIQFFLVGPFLVVSIRLFVFFIWLSLHVILISWLNSIASFQGILQLEHFGLVYFVIIFLIWKQLIDSVIAEFLYALLIDFTGILN